MDNLSQRKYPIREKNVEQVEAITMEKMCLRKFV